MKRSNLKGPIDELSIFAHDSCFPYNRFAFKHFTDMKISKKKPGLVFAFLVFSCAGMAQTNWTIDKEHSSIGFSVSHFQITETMGYFRDYDAGMMANSDDFNGATVTFSAKIASLYTFNEQRDHHLQSDDFFDAAHYPEMRFAGKLAKEGRKYLLKGDLTIRGITKPVSLVTDYTGRAIDSSFKMDKISFVISGSVSRQEFGLKWNETFQGGGPIVGDKVTLHINAEMNRAAKK